MLIFNESDVLEKNAVNNETDNTLKQSINYRMKNSVSENEFNELEISQPRIENPNYTENKIKINEMKKDIIKEPANVTNTVMKDRKPQKHFYEKKNPDKMLQTLS